ncbi:hypothetical protein P5673_007234 [Acropora cervicornis]|uniref:Uncharacterized protein n=1 Tax=Acropora cervicornis TaxID=6130 RepID=A0AAD9VBV5_ACRCE|nr:hypothetical protein P5673_007234 [Acropora cervicornis]
MKGLRQKVKYSRQHFEHFEDSQLRSNSTEFQLVISTLFHEQLIPHALLHLIYVMFARLSSVADSEPVANYKHG